MWATKLRCAACNKRLQLSSVKGVGFKTNAQHFGNICIEIVCTDCKAGYILHYRTDYSGWADFMLACTQKALDAPVALENAIPANESNLFTRLKLSEKREKSGTRRSK